jgi:uncharacterized membrane protein
MITQIDIIAVSWFILCWFGYSILINIHINKKGNIHHKMHDYRHQWVQNLLSRSDRSIDFISLGNFMRSISFFATTSILIIAALVPLLGYGEKAHKFISSLPYTVDNTAPLWEIKTLLLIVIFIYAFFKYTWSLRQYQYASITLLSLPHIDNFDSTKNHKLIANSAKILSNAARHFSMGMRSYYYAIAVLSWYLNPILFIIFTSLIAVVIFRREFMSKALDILS